MAFIRRIKKKSGIYLAKVESYRENGKVKQRVIRYLGKEIEGKACKKTSSADVNLKYVKKSLNILCVDKLFEELGIKEDLDKHFLLLIYSQILENKSINKLQSWIESTILPELLGLKNITTVALYDSLTTLSDLDLEKIMLRLSKYFLDLENSNDTAVIDVTDTYFEGKSQDGKVRKGKDGKVRKLAQFALAVSLENGFPLLYQQYSGNLSDIQIFKDMNIRLSEHGLNTIIVDRGMTSADNIKLLNSLSMKGILGLRKNKKIEIEFINQWPRDKIQTLENRVPLKKSTVYAKSFPYQEGKLIVVYNPHTEMQGREKALQKNKEPSKSYGYSLIFHDTDLPVAKVVATYYEKDTVERAFKQLKGVLNVRPVRFWLKQHISGHFKICYLAYAVLALMKYKLKKINISPEDALDSVENGFVVRLKDKVNNHEWDLHVPLEPKQKKIVKALGVVYKN